MISKCAAGALVKIFFAFWPKNTLKIFLGGFLAIFLKKKFEDFWDKKVEISPQKNFFIAYKNFFWKGKMFLTKNIYIFQIIEFQIKNF